MIETLKLNGQSPLVTQLQHDLAFSGFSCKIDGHYGVKTEAALLSACKILRIEGRTPNTASPVVRGR